MLTNEQAVKNIAANLQRILRDREIPQRQLALKTGDHPTAIGRVYRGESGSAPGILGRIAEALDTSVDLLMQPPRKEIHEKETNSAEAGLTAAG